MIKNLYFALSNFKLKRSHYSLSVLVSDLFSVGADFFFKKFQDAFILFYFTHKKIKNQRKTFQSYLNYFGIANDVWVNSGASGCTKLVNSNQFSPTNATDCSGKLQYICARPGMC